MDYKKIILCISILFICAYSNASTDSPGYKVVHGWPKLPENFELGQVSGVEVDSHDHVWLFHRAGRAFLAERATEPIDYQTILCLNSETGEMVTSFGETMFMLPHGLTVDSEDNIWVTDAELHQVFKFRHDGELLMMIGEKGVPGDDGEHFNSPTDIAVAPNGEFYVADGYGNNRVAKFAGDGSFLFDWGNKGTAEGEFDLPHGIALDAEGRIYVADRSNGRIQVFDSEGKFLAAWKSEALGRPWGLAVSADDFLYVVDGGDIGAAITPRSHFLQLDLEGNIIGKWSSYGKYDGQLIWAHDITVGKNGSVYVGDVYWGMRVQKFVK